MLSLKASTLWGVYVDRRKVIGFTPQYENIRKFFDAGI